MTSTERLIIRDGMSDREFNAGIGLLLMGAMDLRGERGASRPEDDGPDNGGGELVGLHPNFDPSGMGGVALSEGRFNRDMSPAA